MTTYIVRHKIGLREGSIIEIRENGTIYINGTNILCLLDPETREQCVDKISP